MSVAKYGLVLMCLLATAESGTASEKLYDELIERAGKVMAWKAKLQGFTPRGSRKVRGEFEVLFQRPSSIRMSIAGRPLMVSDGRTFWSIDYSSKRATKLDVKKVKLATGVDAAFAWFRSFTDPLRVCRLAQLRHIGLKALNGSQCHVFDVPTTKTFRTERGAMPGRMEVWLREEDGLVIQHATYNAAGEKLTGFTHCDIVKEPPLADGIFSFLPSTDMAVLDVTQRAIRAHERRWGVPN